MKANYEATKQAIFSGAAALLLLIGSAVSAQAAPNPMANIDRSTLANLLVAAPGLSRDALEHGLKAARCAAYSNKSSSPLLTIIDYSKPSSKRRLWVFDIEREEVVYNEWVSHGVNSGNVMATRFSNEVNSRKSSLGVYRTAETYRGKHGYSLKLDGLDGRYNDRARQRAIVIHGAGYVDGAAAQRTGRVGRSWGCPALRRGVSRQVINTIKGGSLVVAYSPQSDWLKNSEFLNCPAAALPAAGKKKFTLQVVQGDTNPPQLQLQAPDSGMRLGPQLSLSSPLDNVAPGYYQAAASDVVATDSVATYEYAPISGTESYIEVINSSADSYFDDTVDTEIPVIESYALTNTLPEGLSYNTEVYGDYSLSGLDDYNYERSLSDAALVTEQSYTGQVNADGEVVETVAFNENGARSSRYLRFTGGSGEEVKSFSFLQ